MSGSFLVTPDDLTSHAGSIDAASGTATTAADATVEVAFGVTAFGTMFAPLGMALAWWVGTWPRAPLKS